LRCFPRVLAGQARHALACTMPCIARGAHLSSGIAGSSQPLPLGRVLPHGQLLPPFIRVPSRSSAPALLTHRTTPLRACPQSSTPARAGLSLAQRGGVRPKALRCSTSSALRACGGGVGVPARARAPGGVRAAAAEPPAPALPAASVPSSRSRDAAVSLSPSSMSAVSPSAAAARTPCTHPVTGPSDHPKPCRRPAKRAPRFPRPRHARGTGALNTLF
jgi:hypothetical protein